MASHRIKRINICYADNMYRMNSFSFYESKNPDFPWDSYDPFTLKNMRDEAECKAEFRVEKKMISTGLPKPCKFQEH